MLEKSAKRVQGLEARTLVRSGEAGMRRAERLMGEMGEVGEGVLEVGLKELDEVLGELRGVIKAMGKIGEGRDEGVEIVRRRLKGTVEGLERTVEEVRKRESGDGGVIEGVGMGNKRVETGGTVVGGEDVSPVEGVRKKVVESSGALIRKATSLREDLGQKVNSFVKDDGSVDFEGLQANVRTVLDNVGETWARLNGKIPAPPGTVNEKGTATETTVPAIPSKENEELIGKLRAEVRVLEKQLQDSSKARESILRKEDQLGKLIRAKEIREMDDNVSQVRRTLAVRVLQLEMETIYSYLAQEVEANDEFMQQRLMIREFGELDKKLVTLSLFVDQNETLLIDDNELGDLAGDIQYLKSRLGLDDPVYTAQLDWPQVRTISFTLLKRTRQGLEFYVRGIRLFGGDLIYALRLIRRAATGRTLMSREVRTIRRTVRDLLTLIPFTILLILPLTPVGHVLIFSFIQKYWPEFFPSTFTDRRQRLMRRHQEYAKGLKNDGEETATATPTQTRISKLQEKLPFLRPRATEKPLEKDNGAHKDMSVTVKEDSVDSWAGNGAADVGQVSTRRILDDLHLAD